MSLPPLVVIAWFLGWILLWRLPRLRPATGPVPDVRTSVVIPARDEADRLPHLLRSLAEQTHPAEEVIVVDDDSSDGTAEVAASFPGTTVVHAPPLPDGWAGKPWACTTGVAKASGDVLVFLDADVVLSPDALAAVLVEHDHSGGLVSVQPRHHIASASEAISLMFNVVAMMGTGVGSMLPPRRQWAATGPLLATSRADHDAVGGHAAVRSAVAEDIELAAAYRASGRPVSCVGGGDLARFRMYRNGRDALWGWRKNLATGAGRSPRLRALAIATWVTGLLVAATVVTGLTEGGDATVAAAVAYGAFALQVGALGRQVGRFGPAAALWPVLVLGFVAVFAWSAASTLVTRRVRWAGRTLDLRPPG